MVKNKTFHKFSPEDLEALKEVVLKRNKRLIDIEHQISELQSKATWLRGNLANLVREIQEGGKWD